MSFYDSLVNERSVLIGLSMNRAYADIAPRLLQRVAEINALIAQLA